MIFKLLTVGKRRELTGNLQKAVTVLAALFSCWVIYANIVALADSLQIGIFFVCISFSFLFLALGSNPNAPDRPTFMDWTLSLSSLACCLYFILIRDDLVTRITLLNPLGMDEMFFGALLLLLTVEATRRTTGAGLTSVVLIFLAYNLWGHYLPPPLGHGYIDFNSFLDILMYTTDGVFGVPIQVTASYVFLFVMFGAFLTRAGGAEFMFQLAAALTGKSPGGPAKIAVVSAGLYGTISGSPTSDVATTGAVNIPIMKRLGYSGRFAGAVEVTASTGGAALPPIMGSAAFILAEYTGIDYRTVALAAFLPAIIYYIGVYLQVHFRALKLGMKGVDDINPILDTLKTGWVFVIPIIVICAALLLAYTPTYVAVFGSLSLLITSFFNKKTRLSAWGVVEALAETTVRILPVAGACAAAGLVIGGLTMTGLAMKGSNLILLAADSGLLILLLVGALITIILGLGMPTPSAYILAAMVIGPAFVSAGIPTLPANMFILYFALLSALTPPVAVAAFAAAAIAEEDAMRIAMSATKLAVMGFVVPFLFVWNESLLFQGPALEIVLAFTGAVVTTIFFAYIAEIRPAWYICLFAIVIGLLAVHPSLSISIAAQLLGYFILILFKTKKLPVSIQKSMRLDTLEIAYAKA